MGLLFSSHAITHQHFQLALLEGLDQVLMLGTCCLKKYENILYRCTPDSLSFKAFFEHPHNKKLYNKSFYVVFLHGFKFSLIFFQNVMSEKVFLGLFTSKQFGYLLGCDFCLVFHATRNKLDNDQSFSCSIDLNNLQAFSTVVTHAATSGFIKLLT